MELRELKGAGPETIKKLSLLGVKDIDSLLRNFPRRYDDYTQVTSIQHMVPGLVTLKARIHGVTGRYVRRGMHITEAIASDDSGSVRMVWFNQPYRATQIKPDQDYFIAGEYALKRNRFSIQNPSVEIATDFTAAESRIVPIYRETKGISSLLIRRLVRQALDSSLTLKEHLPESLIKKLRLPSYDTAIRAIHFPQSSTDLDRAKKRLAFDEVFELTYAALLNKYEFRKEASHAIPFDEQMAKEFVAALPFHLTDGQRRAVWQIYNDINKTYPMNRLLEGDVGSGKTVVAAMAAMMAIRHGYSVALMAPTELLARQHAETLVKVMGSIGYENTIGLLIGSMTATQKTTVKTALAKQDIRFIIGTHALIQDDVVIKDLGMIIVDEQHRFGVEQRKLLQAKAGFMPHVLHMTATPIPRSLALTLYGELDISILDTLPAGRKPISTKVVSPNSRPQLYTRIDSEIETGRQVYIVCPLISEQKGSETGNSSELDAGLPSAEAMYEKLTRTVFKHRRVGLLHGKLKPADKESIMQQFVQGGIDVLVSTTVIEVGVDVPNATVMLIEGAERFGLAQIHQLRGRVGRSTHQSYCFIMPSTSKQVSARLRALESTQDGFALSELDLELRGPGAIYGTLQHGAIDLRVANLSDTRLVAAARNSAQQCIESGLDLVQYPALAARIRTLRAITNLN